MSEQMERYLGLSFADLQQEGIVTIGQKPRDNPKEIPPKGAFAIFLSEEDYPALTPAMWNHAARDLGLDFQIVFLVANPSNLATILAAAKKEPRLKGGVFGVGFKDEAVKFLDEAEPVVQISQSCNVFAKTAENKIAGFNTDGAGFVASLSAKLQELGRHPLEDKKVAILGAGGTSAAITFLLAPKMEQITIINRTVEKAEKLALAVNNYYQKETVKAVGEDEMAKAVMTADVVVNTTTKGAAGEFASFTALAPAGGEWTKERNWAAAKQLLSGLKSKPLICDVVLIDGDTPTIALAKELGLPTLDGRPMNLEQAVPAIQLVFPQVNQVDKLKLKEILAAGQKA